MHTAQYTTTANGAGEVGQYPLSTETLEFIQQQVLLLERLSSLVGVDRPWIIKSPGREETDEGLLAYNGALYPIESSGTYLVPTNRYRLLLREEYKDIFTEDNRFDGARKYETAYLAPDDGAPTSDKELGMVRAISESEVETDNSPSLNGLHEMITTIPVDTYDVDGYRVPNSATLFLPDTHEDGGIISEKVPMSRLELNGAILRTQVFSRCKKSFTQELETDEGVKYRRVYTDTDERSLLPWNVDAYDWRCLPNQVIGSVRINLMANVQASRAELHNQSGVLRGVRLDDGKRGKITLTLEPHVLLRNKDKNVRLEFAEDGEEISDVVTYRGYHFGISDEGEAVITIDVPTIAQLGRLLSFHLSIISR